MRRFRFGTGVDRIFGTSTRSIRRADRRFRADSLPWVERLEGRVLLATIIPSGVISSKPDGSDFDYTIKLTNSSASTSSIGTFWYAWTAVPFEDFLATQPISVTPPAGWTDTITNVGASDGYAIEFISNGSSDNVQPGSSLDFSFTSADTPASVNGDSVFYPGTPVGTSVAYTGAAFASPSAQFVVTPAVATLSSIAVTPANPTMQRARRSSSTPRHLFRRLDREPHQPGDVGVGHDLGGHHHQARAGWRPPWRPAPPRSAPRSTASPARRCSRSAPRRWNRSR